MIYCLIILKLALLLVLPVALIVSKAQAEEWYIVVLQTDPVYSFDGNVERPVYRFPFEWLYIVPLPDAGGEQGAFKIEGDSFKAIFGQNTEQVDLRGFSYKGEEPGNFFKLEENTHFYINSDQVYLYQNIETDLHGLLWVTSSVDRPKNAYKEILTNSLHVQRERKQRFKARSLGRDRFFFPDLQGACSYRYQREPGRKIRIYKDALFHRFSSGQSGVLGSLFSRMNCLSLNCSIEQEGGEAVVELLDWHHQLLKEEEVISENQLIANGSFSKVPLLTSDQLANLTALTNQGSRSVVYAHDGVNRSGKLIVKMSDFNEADDIDNAMHEAFILSMLKHPTLVRYYGASYCHGDCGQLFMQVMEQFPGRDLMSEVEDRNSLLHVNNVAKSAQIITQVLSALSYIHGFGIAHMDIKPENILMTFPIIQGNVKVIDAGLATSTKQPLTCHCGSLNYSAPEVYRIFRVMCLTLETLPSMFERNDSIPDINNVGVARGYCGKKADVWSAAAVLVTLLQKTIPNCCVDEGVEIHKERHADERDFFRLVDTITDDAAKQFVKDAAVLDADRRPTADDLLSHQWLQSYRGRGRLSTMKGN